MPNNNPTKTIIIQLRLYFWKWNQDMRKIHYILPEMWRTGKTDDQSKLVNEGGTLQGVLGWLWEKFLMTYTIFTNHHKRKVKIFNQTSKLRTFLCKKSDWELQKQEKKNWKKVKNDERVRKNVIESKT